MSETKQTTRCPECGAVLPADAPEDLCPRCLLALNLTSPTRFEGDGSTDGAAVKQPLAPAEIAPYFPQLEVLECLGRGGMGAVYKARQKRIDRLVALKILAPERQGDVQFAARFQREARALARLNHPNIVTIHDFGEAGGYCYLLMEFVEGVTLRQLMQQRRLSSAEALAIVPQICDALQFAHTKGIVHRDVKPENIILTADREVKIADFGIAKLVEPEGIEPNLTGAQEVVGTPHYMAPEQAEKPATVDHRADIFSLGVVIYEMLTSELPLGRFSPPSRKVEVDMRLDEIVLRTLEKEPELRYQQASQVKTDLATIASSAPASVGKPATTHPSVAGRGMTTLAWAILMVVLLATGGAVWLRTAKTPPSAKPAGCAPAPSGLVALWSAEGNARDLVGGQNGLLGESTGFGAGKVGQAFVFHGFNDAVVIPASPLLDVGASNGLTLEFWMNPASLSLAPIVEWNDGAGKWGVHIWHSVDRWQVGDGVGNIGASVFDTTGVERVLYTAAGVLAPNVFQHVALTYDKASGVAVIYLNGVAVRTQNLGSFTPLTSYDLYFGARASGGFSNDRYKGLLDEVSLYSRALNPAEIAVIYTAGAAGKCPPPIPALSSQDTPRPR